jgi:hypothetical protein
VRASYLYDFFDAPEQELSLGVSLQLRNAIIDFTGGDGSTFVSSRNVGPVPILKARWRYTFDNAAFLGAEIDGFYANIPIANGDLESSVQGAVCDASLRVGIPVTGFANAYLNLRYIGGGSEGTEIGGDEVDGDGYADNWLHTFSTSLGLEFR